MEKEEKFSPEELKKKSEEAQQSLQKELDKDLPEEELEENIFSIEGVEKGKDWDKIKELRKKKLSK